MEVLSKMILGVPVVGWLMLVFELVLCFIPLIRQLKYDLDVKRYGKEVADLIHKGY